MFALPLAVVMFLFLLRFVEHPSPFSHLINLLLMGVVWWCADRLTWDSTVIDDDEDASGEGLMQRIGVDGPDVAAGVEAKMCRGGLRGGGGKELMGEGRRKGAKMWEEVVGV